MKKMQTLASILLLLAMLLTLVACGTPADTTGAKTGAVTITVKVVHADKTEKTFTIKTEEDTLLDALLQESVVKGEKQTAGYYINEVDGETADWSVDQSWWCLTKGGDMLMTGAERTPIADGDVFEFTYTVG